MASPASQRRRVIIPTEYPDFRKAARAYLERRSATDHGCLLAGATGFALDLDAGLHTVETGSAQTQFRAQVAGTLAGDGMFFWGWSHPSVPAAMGTAAMRLNSYARAHQMRDLLVRRCPATPLRARDYAAMVAMISDGAGVFEGDYGDGRVFVVTYEDQI